MSTATGCPEPRWKARGRRPPGGGRVLDATAARVDLRQGAALCFAARFRAYLGRVVREIGADPESCAFEIDVPAAAYVALDRRLDRFPGYDLALTWSEVHGWAVALEHDTGLDITVLAYLGGPRVLPAPEVVAAFLDAVHTDADVGQLPPPSFRAAGRHGELAARLPRAAWPRRDAGSHRDPA
ncbi:DUF6292 family protein [Amycolatopsis sp. NBC_00355]|uniref:DUF6292 family protein n=1 Tax=Amycolatopsis sp. NBC_00355 TaxID=2975957 RepID=UPI002E25392C